MGVVHRGFDPDIRRIVALKTIRQQLGEGADAAQTAARLRNAAQAAGRLLHPGIAGVYDLGETDTRTGRVAYIAMEFVEGHALSQYLQQEVRLSEADVASLATQLLDALAHAHDNGVWHCDIRPSNVIITKAGRIKIADFGIARTDTSALTMANSVPGTPMDVAPEQSMGRPIDHRVDVYGSGAVLYQLIAGRAPFVGPHEALTYKLVNEGPAAPSSIEGALGDGRFDAVVATALAKDPRERYASAAAFCDAMAQALGQAAPGAVSREAVFALPARSEYALHRAHRQPPRGAHRQPWPGTGHQHHGRAAHALGSIGAGPRRAFAGPPCGAAGRGAGAARRQGLPPPAEPAGAPGRADHQPAGARGLPRRVVQGRGWHGRRWRVVGGHRHHQPHGPRRGLRRRARRPA
ncbi:MAG: hypothetical protein RL227_1123, partial [Pseudomonadota bacterium]